MTLPDEKVSRVDDRPDGRRLVRREALAGLAFISPWILGFTVFWIGPLLYSLAISMTDLRLNQPVSWVALSNYLTIVFDDRTFWGSVFVTIKLIAIYVPISVALSLVIALLLQRDGLLSNMGRAVFFAPSVTPIIAGAMLWFWIYSPRYGLANYYLATAGLPTSRWVASPDTANISIIIVMLWLNIGGSRMLIFLAGLKNIPVSIYQAALVDGAGPVARFVYITLPMLTPVILLNVVIAVIYAFQVFDIAYSMTGGGPIDATNYYMLNVYKNAFEFFKFGYASALSWFLFLAVAVLTALQLRASRRWVRYAMD